MKAFQKSQKKGIEGAHAAPNAITFRRRLNHSSEMQGWMREKAEKLETFYDRILGRRVALEVPHRHHQAVQRDTDASTPLTSLFSS